MRLAWAAFGMSVGLALACAAGARGAVLAAKGKATADIVVGSAPTPAEQTAAAELRDYLAKVTGAAFAVRPEGNGTTQPAGGRAGIYVGDTAFARRHGLDTAKLGPEEWVLRTVGDDLVLTGGRPRGTLYAACRFLEDVVGVHWWNPWEEHVPRKADLAVAALDRKGAPRFRYRDIYMLYGRDGGRFAARNRLNRDGDAGIAPAYGGEMGYGPPYHVHTFYMYVPPETHFAQHPEWFSLIGPKRTAEHAQLCLTNAELRREFVGKLKAYIAQSRAAAARAGAPAPAVFDVSQNDWGGMCQCKACGALADAEGSQAGPLLDFVNYLADAVKAEYPDVCIDTLAYQMTQAAPRTIRPRDNVIVRLCDTTSNFTRPITHEENRPFREHLLSWAKITRNLRVWDYAVTYAPYYGLPLPTLHTYPADYRFYAEHNVEGVFTEHEYPILADMRDLKVWMMIKLLEDPYRDYDALLADLTDGFYGPAGVHVRAYLSKLQAAAKVRPSHLSMGASPRQYRYLDVAFLREASGIFDEAAKAVANDAVLARRVRHARLPLDRATVVLFPQLVKEWARAGNDPAKLPLDRAAAAERYGLAWREQIDLRLAPDARAAERRKADAEVKPLLARPAWVPPPAKFQAVGPERLFDFTADETRNWQDIAKRVPDPQAESGITNRLELSDQDMAKYKLPMPWGLYDVRNKRSRGGGAIRAQDVPGPGYDWYKMGTFAVGPSCYLYFFWSWIIQVDVDSAADPSHPQRKFQVWARIKFEGPGFPHGRTQDKNAICVERVVLVAGE